MKLHHLCETIFSEPRTTQRRGIMFLLIGVIVLTYWGCGSSNNSEPSRVTEENGPGLRLAIQMPSGSDPADIDRFEISVTGPGISLYSRVNPVGDFPFSVALGDVDGDDVLDVVTANADSDDVSILLGFGDGRFEAAVSVPVGDGPASVALGDVDGDDVLDVVTANSVSDDVSILLGIGDGRFEAADPVSVRDGPSSVALGDVNGDGRLDVVTANVNSNNVSILLGSGGGAFFSAQLFFVGGSPSSVALVDAQGDRFDVNGDGFLDIITTQSGADSVSILRSDTSLKDIPHTPPQYERVTIGGRDKLVFYLTLSKEVEVPEGPNRTFTVRAFLPGSSEPDFRGSTTPALLSRDTSVVVTLTRTSSSE